jgi:Rrf2 family protein
MSLSTRFPVAIHILTLLSIMKGEYVSSEFIAKSVATNAVVIRRVLGLLQQAGFVVTMAGSRGGAKINVDPKKITLLDIFEVVEEQSLFRMHSPQMKCPVATVVVDQVNGLIHNAEEKMKKELAKTSLASITKPASVEFKKRMS